MLKYLSAALLCISAHAAVMTFVETGFSEGAELTLVFDGSDLNGDGWISGSDGEIRSLRVTFSGNTQVAPFRIAPPQQDFFALFYRLGDGILGDTSGGYLVGEGVQTGWGALGYSMGPAFAIPCGGVDNCAGVFSPGGFDFSTQPLRLHASVPFPFPALLLTALLFALGAQRRLKTL